MLENKPYTPAKYGKELFGVTGTTVINWIKANKMPDNTKIEKTSSGTSRRPHEPLILTNITDPCCQYLL